ncbi:MAG: 3-hydroxyacyl-CoA dehydrogenase/enoyl-CoA hydratase family protein [Saprospiraceae bacterium]
MRRIRKAAVLGSGVMGSAIACHLANIGLEVLLLDIVPFDLNEKESGNPAARNRIVNDSLRKAIANRPAPLYHRDFASRIETGNFSDDMHRIKNADWTIEVVVERLDIKRQILEQVDKHRTPGTLISTNTSGIPIHMMLDGRSDDFRRHFCGTHFFNPPRYLELLEIIPSPETDPAIVSFFMDFGSRFLGKQTVECKDTPAFIANRVGVYAMGKVYDLTKELGISIEDADKLTGPAIGRPNTGTFRLGDLVGLDVALKVMEGIKQNCPDDEQMKDMEIPEFLKYLVEHKFLGNKTGQGFYQKTKEKDDKGRSVILGLDLNTHEYRPAKKKNYPSLGVAKQIDDVRRRVKAVANSEDEGGQLVKRSLAGLFAYVSNRIPEISDHIYSIDQAIKAGFAWELGPFEYWEAIGLAEGKTWAEAEGYSLSDWASRFIEAGHTSFYENKGEGRYCYDPLSDQMKPVGGLSGLVLLDRNKKPVYQNDEVILHDIGDGVLNLEFTSKANAIGEGILRGIQESIALAENDKWQGMVIGNTAKNFSVGANLMLMGMMAFQQEFDELNLAVKLFQDTSMRCRYSAIPVVAATQGYVFGGGCELQMHCDATLAAAESYIGLVEAGVGLIPGGGGTKEFAVRTSDAFQTGEIEIPTLLERFKTIALAAVSTSAYEAFDHKYLLPERDEVVVRGRANIAEAKAKVLELAKHYIQPVPREDIRVLGRQGLATLLIGAHSLKLGHYASEHDIKIAQKMAFVLSGGDLSSPQNVSEQYLLDLEREAFLSLCGEPKTLERIQYMLENNKPLRN